MYYLCVHDLSSLFLTLSLLSVIRPGDRTIFLFMIYLLSLTLPRFSLAYI